jgi:MFS family permease
METTARTRSRRAVRRLALAQLISVAGSFAASTALLYRVYAITRSTLWVTATALATSTAVVLVGLAGGILADRFDRRRVMVLSDLAGAGCFVVLAMVHSPGAMVALAFAAAVAEAPFWPASSAAVPNLVEEVDVPWANSLLMQATYAALSLGPLAGGAMVAGFGAPAAFFANAGSFLVSAAILAGTRGRFAADRPTHEREHPDRRIWAGLALVASRAELRVLTTVVTVIWASFGLFVVVDVPLAAAFHAGPVGYAMLTAIWGGTAFAGSRLAPAVLSRIDEGLALAVGLLVMAVTGGSIAVLPSFAAIVAVGGAGGIGQGVVMVAWRGMVQQRTPDAVRGRFFAVTDAFQEAAFAVGMLGGGALAGLLGIQPSYLVPGALLLVASALGWRLRADQKVAEPIT